MKYLELFENYLNNLENEQSEKLSDIDFNTTTEVYEYFGEKYPLASHAVCFYIYGNKEYSTYNDIDIDSYEIGQTLFEQEYNWKYNMEQIEEDIKYILNNENI